MNTLNYTLPIADDWTTDETIALARFTSLVLAAYEQGVNREQLLTAYNTYRTILPAKSEQKQFDRDFEKQTGASIYRALQAAQASAGKQLRMTAR